MSALHFPGKYHTVWLDRHIGNHGFYVQLKHIFFTQIDPNSAREFETSDTDGDPFKKSDEERPVTFENSHFTLNAFTNEDACFEKLFIRRQKLDARYGLGPGLSETQPFSLEIEEIDRLLELASIPVMEDSSEATTYITAITCEQMKDAEDYIRQYILAWLDKALGDDKSA
ncbi:unnamed protein product, partial [Rotaria socialis]